MSQGSWGFAIDIDEMRRSIGSKDRQIIAAIEERHAEHLSWDDDRCAHDPDEVAVRHALKNLILVGDPLGNLGAFDLLCAQMGTRLEDEDDVLGDLENLDVPSSLFAGRPPLVPGWAERVRFVPASEIHPELEQLASLPEHDDEEVEAARAVLRSFYERADSLGKALVILTG